MAIKKKESPRIFLDYIVYILHFLPDKVCDGIVHCYFGEDEADETCKKVFSFPEVATIECIENRFGYNITIKAIPCDGVLECRNGIDEDCIENKKILYSAMATLIVMTYGIYHYIKWKLLVWKDLTPSDQVWNDKWISLECANFAGDDLAELKVSIVVGSNMMTMQTK